MPKRPVGAYKNLIGEYPLLSDKQKEYIRIRTDPSSKIDGLSDTDIANAIGVHPRTLAGWKVKKDVRDALIAETNRKKADKYPDILSVIENIIFDNKAENRDKLKAVDLWGKFHGVTEEAKQKITEKKTSDGKRFEDYVGNIGKTLGDDIEYEFDDADTDEQSEELYTGSALDKDESGTGSPV